MVLIIKNIIFTSIAALGFAVFFGMREKRLLMATGCCAMFGYLVYELMALVFDGVSYPTIFAALTVGVMAEFFSRSLKVPATIMILPGIVPLVPGTNLYRMMQHFVQEDFWNALREGANTLFISGSIALGITASSLFSLSLRRVRKRNIRVKRKV